MSYRSKRTMAQMMEADDDVRADVRADDVPPAKTPSSLTSSTIISDIATDDTDNTGDRWGPFCPKKNKIPAVIKPHQQQPSLQFCRPHENNDESYAAKSPLSNDQVNSIFEKPPNGPGTRLQISNKHASKFDQPHRSFTNNPIHSKPQATSNSPILASGQQLHASKKMGEQAQQVVVKPPLWKTSVKPGRSFNTPPLLAKTHATTNSHDLAARKARELSAKHPDESQKMAEQTQIGVVKPPDSLWKKSTTKNDRPFTANPLHSHTHAIPNSLELVTKKARGVSAKQPDASPKMGEQAQAQKKPSSSVFWKNSPTNTSRVFTLNSTSGAKSAASNSQPTLPLPPEIVDTANNGSATVEKSSVEAQKEVLNQEDVIQTGCITLKPRRRSLVRDWPDNVEFDESEEVLTMDEEGNIKKVNDPIQPNDVWCTKGERYCVTFNEFHQPLKKGGHILVRFIGDIARKERFCPIRITNWHHVPEALKVEIVKCIRKFSECGKEARASQNHVHTTGSTSYANIRAEFEEKNKREPTELEVFKETHKRKDGSYVKDTVTEEFVLDADTYIQSEIATNPAKSKVQIQNEAFSKLMYGEDAPKRPLGYGFGVKGSDVFGVNGILRKEAFISGEGSSISVQNSVKMQNMEKAVVSLTKENRELQSKLNDTNFILCKILEGMSPGILSPELARIAKSTLKSQISDSTNTFGDGASR